MLPTARPTTQQTRSDSVLPGFDCRTTQAPIHDYEVARLERFLFGADRVSLQPFRAHLVELQHGACFYCAEPLTARSEVDHFPPWSRHPDDRTDNLVVAHRRCNVYKKDFLASAEHLRTWAARLADRDRDLDQIAADAGWPRDTHRTLGVNRASLSRSRSCGSLIPLDVIERMQPGTTHGGSGSPTEGPCA